MHPALTTSAHRSWPVPPGRWTWRQSWCDLLFAHWPLPASQLRPHVPDSLTIQEWDGTSYIGVVPFRMSGVMRRPFPDVPWLSAFPELNVRLYVERDNKPGVWFLSLDATNPIAVWAARRFFHLPYFRARIDVDRRGDRLCYRSRRTDGGPPAHFHADYEPVSGVRRAVSGTLEHFLTERYCLYAQAPDGALYRTEIHHEPWPLQAARAELDASGILGFHGLAPLTPPALLHFAQRVDVVVWPPHRCA